jgi:reactive intermediate/imine deaminase
MPMTQEVASRVRGFEADHRGTRLGIGFARGEWKEDRAVDKTQVNPWKWQDRAGFSQAWRVDEASALVFVSGQAPVSAEGQLVGEGDFDAQTRQVFENLRTVLAEAGSSLEDVVKLTVYVTDIARLPDFARVKSEFVEGPQPGSTALEVSALARPEMMIEVEAIAVA